MEVGKASPIKKPAKQAFLFPLACCPQVADSGHGKLYQGLRRHSHSTTKNPLRNFTSRGILIGLACRHFFELRSKNLAKQLIYIIFLADS